MFPQDLTNENSIRVINAKSISSLLNQQEALIVDRIRSAYESHSEGLSNLPHSVFLRFPNNAQNRIIGLPSFLDGEQPSAGFKWIASFPGNHAKSLDRASALMILNSMNTGFPKAVLEASIISAKRTAASAALASLYLHPENMQEMGIIGCGLIGFEIIKFIKSMHPELQTLRVYDLSRERSAYYIEKLKTSGIELNCEIMNSVDELFTSCSVIALATTSPSPYIKKSHLSDRTKLILNISLRDLDADIILSSINVVDDVDHVCRENTSIHLAEQKSGDRNFIHATIADITKGSIKIENPASLPIVFSPFGLGVLDLTVAEYVYEQSCQKEMGELFNDFFPSPWQTPVTPKHSLDVNS